VGWDGGEGCGVKPRRVLTAGTFDLFHAGHVELLRRCAWLGDVTVAVNTDEFVKAYKGQAPVIGYENRARVVGSCRWVTLVVPQPSSSLADLIGRVRPDFLAVGSDWARKDYHAQIGVTQDWLDERGVILVYIPYTPHVSSTDIRRRLNAA
jgi:glycerol-3-phosphate cytidylyltransferase